MFLQGILLDQVRDNIADQEKAKGGKTGGRLDVQLYEALKKGLYKPAAWFKGILFPLCEVSCGAGIVKSFRVNGVSQSGCSLKEATVVASVLSKVSVPVLHSAAALMRLAGMDYSGKHMNGSLAAPCVSTLTFAFRSKFPVHPGTARQKVCAPVQGRGRPRFPLYPVGKLEQEQGW